MDRFSPKRISMTTPSTDPERLTKPYRSEALGAILLDWRRERPDHPLLLLKEGLQTTPEFEHALFALLRELESKTGGPVVLTALSNADPRINPWAGLPTATADAMRSGSPAEPGCAARPRPGSRVEPLARPRRAVIRCRGGDARPARYDARATRCPDCKRPPGDCCWQTACTCTTRDAALGRTDELQPHEERRPPAWGALTERLDDWLRNEASPADPDSPAADLAEHLDRAATASAATLHVTHSWGGGVARWTETFIDADHAGVNFQLRAEGPETGAGCGQRLSLYLGNRLQTPVASWWLQPPILSSAEEHPAYREILREAARALWNWPRYRIVAGRPQPGRTGHGTAHDTGLA